MKQTAIYLILFVLLCIPQAAWAIDDPDTEWEELESEHFIIHYPAQRADFAKRALSIAEEAHTQLIPNLKWIPDGKTHLSVTDNLDEANGWARPVPSNEIRLYAYPPIITEELGLYDDWMRQLIYHEYTHILHTDNSHGLHPVLNIIFGKFARNNATAPPWYTEGMAVYYETLMSNRGRLRNSLYRTMLRNAALSNRIPELGELSTGLNNWPGYSSHYLFGAFFIQYIANQYGRDSLTRWNHEYGDDWIPYALNRAALRIWGKTWDELYESWRNEVISRAQAEYESQKDTITPHESILSPWRHTNPQIHGNLLTYSKNDGYHPKTITVRDLTTLQETDLVRCWGQCSHQWNEDRTILYFMHSPTRDGYQQFETLYTYDSVSKKITHLDIPGRIRSFSVDRDAIYWVEQIHESNRIGKKVLNSSQIEYIYTGVPFEQIESLSVKDDQIIASVFDVEQQQFDICILNQENRWQKLTDDSAVEMSPFWMHDGSIGYISDKSGDLNLWKTTVSGQIHECLTQLLDGILHPSESDNGDIYYTQYTAQGTTIARISSSDIQPVSVTPAPVSKSVSYAPLKTVSLYPPSPYRPWRWLWPLTWSPRYSWSETDKTAVGISVTGSDYLDHHIYTFYFDYITGKDAVNFDLSYTWAALIWDLGFSAGILQNTARYRDDLKYRNFDYQKVYGDIIAKRIWNGRLWSQSITLGYHLEFSESHDPLSWSKRNPAARPVSLPALGWTNAFVVRWGWSNATQTEKAFVTNNGYSINAAMRFEAPWLGADQYTGILSMSASGAWTMPYLASHIFSLSLSGGATWSENPDRQPFTLASSQGFRIDSVNSQLHAYPAGLLFGRHYMYGHAQYTASLLEMEIGHSTLPVGLDELGVGAFGDWGYAWTEDFEITHSKFAIGANLYLDLTLGYRLPVRLTLGYAWGGAPGGGHEIYLLWGL